MADTETEKYGMIIAEVNPDMKLMFIVANDEYASDISTKLKEHNFMVTEVGSTGDFLQYGETLMLLGVEDDECDRVISVLHPKQEAVKGKEKTPYRGEVAIYVTDIAAYSKVNA